MSALAARVRGSFDVRNRRNRQRLVANAIGLVVLAVMLFPVYWMIATSFKPGRDIFLFYFYWFPSPATLGNFSEALHRPYFADNIPLSFQNRCARFRGRPGANRKSRDRSNRSKSFAAEF